MKALYTTKVTATGGRHGQIRSEDGLLDMKLALPRELGGKGDATNPETLFAGGYAACFENALLRVSREDRLKFADEDVEVTAEISLSRNDAGKKAKSPVQSRWFLNFLVTSRNCKSNVNVAPNSVGIRADFVCSLH